VSERPLLREVARRCGIAPGYVGTDGAWHETSDASREALLAAMGVDAADEASAARALASGAVEAAPAGVGPAASAGAASGSSCRRVEDALGAAGGGGRAFGLQANLYTLRSAANWGVGDLGDLRSLVAWAAAAGASFVGINPLSALDDGLADGNPYFPISRLYFNWIYIDVAAVPELAASAELRRRAAAWHHRLRELRAAAVLDWRQLIDFKRQALLPLYEVFRRRRDDGCERGTAFAEFRRRSGRSLIDFATHCALAEHFGTGDWRDWPAEFQSCDATAVADFRSHHPQRVELFEFLQFELDRQLGGAAAAAAAALPLGIYGDLPVGVAPGGSDVWSFRRRFVTGARIGAPPDPYSASGQNWGLAPLDPRTLLAPCAGSGAGDPSYWRLMLEQNMRHCGVLRIDHAMGLVRQFWIPAGRPACEGAYVAYPTAAMIDELAAASHRHHCAVVAEDLGTVPEGFREDLRRWGILRNQILYFERRAGAFVAPDQYDREALVAANTHDLPPLAGFWEGTDLELRAAGGVAGGEDLEAARAARREEIEELRAALRESGLVGRDWQPASAAELCAAVNEFLAGAPSRLLAVSLDDLGGEKVPINVPSASGLATLWSRRMSRSLEDLRSDADNQRALRRIREIRGDRPGAGTR
jgi:4-alpha-glucanotransferase